MPALIEKLPPDARQLFTYMLGHDRSDDGGLRAFEPTKLARAMAWDSSRLRRAQDLLIACDLAERWPRLMEDTPAVHVRLTVVGEALGHHGFSVEEFREACRAEAVKVGALSVNGSRDVTIAVGNGINIGGSRLASREEITIGANGCYSAHYRQILLSLDVRVPQGSIVTLVDPLLTLDVGSPLLVQPTDMVDFGPGEIPGFASVDLTPVLVEGVRRFTWHFSAASPRLIEWAFDHDAVAAVLEVDAVDIDMLTVPCVVRRIRRD